MQPKSDIPGLGEMSEERLKELLQNDELAKCFCESILPPDDPSVVACETSAREGREAVERLVSENKALQGEAEQKRETLLNKFHELVSIKAEVQGLRGEIEAKRPVSASVSGLCERMRSACTEDEDESDRIAEGFLGGDVGLAEFTAKYLEIRSRHHLRKAKLDKLKEALARPGNPF